MTDNSSESGAASPSGTDGIATAGTGQSGLAGTGQSGLESSSVSSPQAAGVSDVYGALQREAASHPALWERYLRGVVRRLSGCLSTLSPQAQRLLVLRAGFGVPQSYSSSQVAHMLGISVATERRGEYSAVTALQGAAQNGGCSAGQASIPVTVLPAGHGELVTIEGVQPGAASFVPAARALSAALAARSNSQARQNKSQPRRRAVAAVAVQRAEVSPSLRPGSGISGWLIAALALMGAMGVLLIARARPGARERLAAAGGSAPEAIPPTPVIDPQPRPETEVGERPTTEADQAGGHQWLSGLDQAEAERPPAADLDSAAAEAWIPKAATYTAEAPEAQPATPRARSRARRASWLTAQRRHTLMALAAVGGAVRLVRRRRRSPRWRR